MSSEFSAFERNCISSVVTVVGIFKLQSSDLVPLKETVSQVLLQWLALFFLSYSSIVSRSKGVYLQFYYGQTTSEVGSDLVNCLQSIEEAQFIEGT